MLAVLVALSLLGAGSAVFAADVQMTGSTTVLPIAQAVAEALAGTYEIEVSGGGSSVGVAALIDGTTDIADHSRPIKASEFEKAVANGVFPFSFHVAQDAIAVVVNPVNPVSGITVTQLKEIYLGKIVNWKELGGDDAPIVVVSRDSSSGTFDTWKHIIMNSEGILPSAIYTTSNADVAGEVVNNPNAIGYIGLGYLQPGLKALIVDGVTPTVESAISGEYPITRPLFMSTNGYPSGVTLEVIRFILSEEGQQIVVSMGYAPIRALCSGS
jgi:phosphate transport system substrate-binding protein